MRIQVIGALALAALILAAIVAVSPRATLIANEVTGETSNATAKIDVITDVLVIPESPFEIQ